MTTTINQLSQNKIYAHGSAELMKFERQLTTYFTREFRQHKGNDILPDLGHGPIALDPVDLANDHYNEGLSFFNNFLDNDTMSYTMALFDKDPEKARKSNKTLSQAQLDKFELLASRMKLKGKEHLLNFGCGFGFFESYLLNLYPTLKISSTTHSSDQYMFLTKRMNNPDDSLSSNRFKLFLGEIGPALVKKLQEQKYDIVSSVGLLEQINNMEKFFELISQLLPNNGQMFHHLIVSRDIIPQLLDPKKTLIGKYFPGGKVLSFSTLQKYTFTNFSIQDSWFINGMNYWMTIEKWHENFWRNIQHIFPEQMGSDRIQYWNNYFVLCKAMFFPENGEAYGNGQYLFVKN